MPTQVNFGPHTFTMSADEICVLSLVGAFELPEAEQFVRDMLLFQEKHTKAVLLVDMTRAQTVRPASRKAIIAGVREKPYPVCFIKASFAIRALVGLMLNAAGLFGNPLPHAFVDSEEAGRIWAKSVQPGWRSVRGAAS